MKFRSKPAELSDEDRERIEYIMESPTIRVLFIPGEFGRGPNPNSPVYKKWKKQNGKA